MRTLLAFVAGVALVGGLWFLSSRDGGMRMAVDGEPVTTGVGAGVPDFAFLDLDGETGVLSNLLGKGPVVVVMRDTGCPVARKYGHELARLEAEYGEEGVRFLFLNVSPQDSPEEARAEVELFGFQGSYILDRDNRVRPALQPETTTEVFVIDAGGRLRYRGAVDDQYGIDFAKPEPRETWLRDALDALLAGEEVPVTSTFASGCYLPRERSRTAASEITWHGRVSRIVQENCEMCHRDGGVAPFSLASYENAAGYRGMIQYMVSENRMPPWFASPEHGEWSNDRTLDPRDKLDLLTWIAAGAPEGDPKDAPRPRDWVAGWEYGAPDAVVAMEEPFPVPAEGVVDYQYLYVKTDFPEDRWISSIEIQPGSRQVVHHVLAFLEAPDAPREERSGGIDGYFAAYVPGFTGNRYPEGAAKRLPAGAWIKLQLHYTPNGAATEDVTRIGFRFADGPPERVVETTSAFNARFEIPPGAKHHEVSATYTFREPGEVLSLFPHMHLRGAAFRYVMTHPDGTEEVLLDIPRYDFNWQLGYYPAEPIRVEPGTRIVATGWFDNSEENPYNPDPTVPVRFGEQTFEEMMIGYFDWIPDRPLAQRLADGDGDKEDTP